LSAKAVNWPEMADASGASGRPTAPPEQLRADMAAVLSSDAQRVASAARRRTPAMPDQGMQKLRRSARLQQRASTRSSQESVLDSPDLLLLVLSKCGIRDIFAAAAVCRSWQARAQSVLLLWQEERCWSEAACADNPADAAALCEEALAVLHLSASVFAESSSADRCRDAAGLPDAARFSDKVLVACVELLRATRSSRAASDVRSKVDRCFLKWLTLLGTPEAVDAAIHRAVAPLVHLHIRTHSLPPSARGARWSSCYMPRKVDFQESLGPLLRQLVDPHACLCGLSTMTAMLRVMRMCSPFFSLALGNRIFEHLQRIGLNRSLLSSLGCPPEAQPQLPQLILEVLRLAPLQHHVLHALPLCISRIVAHSGDETLRLTLASALAAHGVVAVRGSDVAPAA
jgi:hypothetical protein